MLKRIFTCITLLCFSAQNVAVAIPIYLDNVQPAIGKRIFIPESFGVIEKTSLEKYPSSKFVVLLKDAHCNYDAQHNIAKILEVLVKEYKIDLVAMEGAVGDLDYSRFDKMNNENAREKMADHFVKKGVLTGPEYLKIARDGKLSFNVYGIENEKLYVENFIAFRETINNQGETIIFINELQRIVKNLKSKMYRKELFEFDSKAVQYYENAISLTDWIKELAKEGSARGTILKDYPNIGLTLDSVALEEKIDFKRVESERAEAINNLGKVLSKEKLKEMIGQSLQFRIGKISSNDYYEYLDNLLKSLNGINSAEKYSNLVKYIQLVKLQAWINNNMLFSEIAKLEDSIKRTMFQNNIQYQLDDISKKARILNGLFSLALNRDDLLYYRNHKAEFMPDSIISFINIQAPANGIPTSMVLNNKEFLDKVRNVITDGEKFYDIAIQRDVSLVENTLRVMEERKKLNAVMVLGGFHTEGVLNLFEKRGVGYAVITPKIVTADKEGLYLSLMMDKRIQPKAEVSSLSYPHPLAGGEANERLFVRLGAKDLPLEYVAAAEQLYNKLAGKKMGKEIAATAILPFNISANGDVSINSEAKSDVPPMVLEWLRKGLEEVLKNKDNQSLRDFVNKAGNSQKYLNKSLLVDYEHSIGDARQQGVLRNVTLGFLISYLAMCNVYEEGGFLKLSKDPKSQEFIPEVIKELEAGKGYKWPELRETLKEAFKAKGLDEAFAMTITNYLLTMPAYRDEGRGFYQTLFFNSYLGLIRNMLGVVKGDDLDKLLDKLRAYRFVQFKIGTIFKVDLEPVLEADNIKDLLRTINGKAAEMFARYIISNGTELKEFSEDIGKIIRRKRELSGVDWVGESDIKSVNNEGTVSDPIKRDAYVAALTGFKLTDIRVAFNRYEDIIKRFKERLKETLPDVSQTEAGLKNPTTFVRGIPMYIGDVKEIEEGKYEFSDLGAIDIESINEVQSSKQNDQYFLYKEDKQKEAMKVYLAKYGIKVEDRQFIRLDRYKEDIPRTGRVIVTMVSDEMRQDISKLAAPGDRILIGNSEGSDLMLMSRLALIIAGPKDIEQEKDELEINIKELFRLYYMGTIDEREIEKIIAGISISEGIFKIILPPITPFVREYYDILMKTREIISKAA